MEAQHLLPTIYWDAGRPVAHVFNEEEGRIFKELLDDGMDLAIRVTSDSVTQSGGNNVVFAVPT